MSLTNLKRKHLIATVAKFAAALLLMVVAFSPIEGAFLVAHGQTPPSVQSGGSGAPGVEPAPGSDVFQQAQATVPAAQQQAQANVDKNPDIGESSCSPGNFSVCLTNIVYALTVGLMSIFAYIGAYIFDIGVQLTLQTVTYSQSFLTTGWATVRDIANMAFIFILVYLAITIVLRADTANTLRMLAVTIIVALLINFSFFITRVVIDAGNILAVQFYNSIQAPSLAFSSATASASSPTTVGAELTGALAPNTATKDLTANIMNLIGVQTLLSSGSFSNTFQQQHNFLVNLIVFSFVYIAVGAILAMLAFTFITVGIKFLIRIVMLWLAIIAAPLAFVARALTNSNGAKKIYTWWQDTLIQNAFYPAIFLFLFVIINIFATGMASGQQNILNAAFQGIGGSSSTVGSYIVPVASAVSSIGVRLGLIIILLFLAMKISDKVASEGNGIAKGASGWMGNKFSGAAAWSARHTVGRAAYSGANSTWARDFAAKSVLGRPVMAGLKGLSTSRLDIRGVAGVKSSVSAVTGVKLGDAGGKGGFDAQVKARATSVKKRAEDMKANDIEIKKEQDAFDKNERKSVSEKLTRDVDITKDSANIMREQQKDLEKSAREAQGRGDTAAAEKYAGEASNKAETAAKLDAESRSAKKELDGLDGEGKRRVEERAKKRIGVFARRIGDKNFQNVRMPSKGSVKGSVEAWKLIKEKSKETKFVDAAKDYLKETPEEGPEPPPPAGGGGAGGGGGAAGSGGGGGAGHGAGGAAGHGAGGGTTSEETNKILMKTFREMRGIKKVLTDMAAKEALPVDVRLDTQKIAKETAQRVGNTFETHFTSQPLPPATNANIRGAQSLPQSTKTAATAPEGRPPRISSTPITPPQTPTPPVIPPPTPPHNDDEQPKKAA